MLGIHHTIESVSFFCTPAARVLLVVVVLQYYERGSSSSSHNLSSSQFVHAMGRLFFLFRFTAC